MSKVISTARTLRKSELRYGNIEWPYRHDGLPQNRYRVSPWNFPNM